MTKTDKWMSLVGLLLVFAVSYSISEIHNDYQEIRASFEARGIREGDFVVLRDNGREARVVHVNLLSEYKVRYADDKGEIHTLHVSHDGIKGEIAKPSER